MPEMKKYWIRGLLKGLFLLQNSQPGKGLIFEKARRSPYFCKPFGLSLRTSSMRIKPFQALYPNFDFIASPDSFCANAKERYREFQKSVFFEKMPEDAMFVYEIESEGRRHLGLIAQNDVQDFFEGRIIKHENTLREKEQQQMQMFLRWHAVLKPVLLTFSPVEEINAWLQTYAAGREPMFVTRFERDGQTHRVWPVTDVADIALAQRLFEKHISRTYIADGHHRTTTVALLHERLRDKNPVFDFDNLFCAYFPSDQLDILDFNRVVELPVGMGAIPLIVRLSKVAELEILGEARKPVEKHELVFFLQGEWYSLRWKANVLQALEHQHVTLDANLLNELVLRDILGITDVRTDARISYVEGARGLDGIRRAVGDRPDRVGFLLYPVSFDDMMQMADAGETLPPKSTYFEPRMKSGMLVKILKRDD